MNHKNRTWLWVLAVVVLIAAAGAYFWLNRTPVKAVEFNSQVRLDYGDPLTEEDIIVSSADGTDVTLDEEELVKDKEGNYKPGTYRVGIYVDGKKEGESVIRVISPDAGKEVEAAAVTPETSKKEDPKTAHKDDPEVKAELERQKKMEDENIEPTVISNIVIVNKKNPLGAQYNPGEDPYARSQADALVAEMKAAGFDVGSASGYRDYERQKSIYNGNLLANGLEAADSATSRPGYAEQQTGLTFDLRDEEGNLVRNEQVGEWLTVNAPRYGFIVRYPKGKEAVTGYDYQPFKIRYVGPEIAEFISQNGITLEEYFGIEGGDYPDAG